MDTSRITPRDIFLKIADIQARYKDQLQYLQEQVAPDKVPGTTPEKQFRQQMFAAFTPTNYWFGDVLEMARKGLLTGSAGDLPHIKQCGPMIIAEDIGTRLVHRRSEYSSRDLVKFDRGLRALRAFAEALIREVEPLIDQYKQQNRGRGA